jgi:hypothetical protein
MGYAPAAWRREHSGERGADQHGAGQSCGGIEAPRRKATKLQPRLSAHQTLRTGFGYCPIRTTSTCHAAALTRLTRVPAVIHTHCMHAPAPVAAVALR